MSELNINTSAAVDFLVNLLNIPSPTGYAVEAIDYTHRAFEALHVPGLEIRETPKGALVMRLPGQSSAAPRGLTAHVDTLGLMVKEIKGSGRLKVTMLGGYAWNAVEYEGVTIRTFDNRRYRGTMLLANNSTHVNARMKDTERSGDTMEIRIDECVRSAAETAALGISVGDFVFLDPRVELSQSGFIRSRHLDDKASVAAIYAALMALNESGQRPAQDTTILIANYEEVGHGGSAGFPRDLAELVAVDMAAMGDGQTSDEFSVTVCVKDSTGPYHFDLSDKLRRLATQHGIPHKVDIYPFYGSDGSAYWRAGGDARVALVGPGVDGSHGYERTHRDAITHTAHLLARYLVE